MENNSTKQTQAVKTQSAQDVSTLKRFNACISSDATQQYLQQVLREKKSSFSNNIIAVVSNNAALQECQPMSLIYAGIKATALDLPLDPNLGFASLSKGEGTLSVCSADSSLPVGASLNHA